MGDARRAADVLRRSALFAGAADDILAVLAPALERRTLSAGDVLIRQGDP